jgi:DNA repair protein RadD
VLAVSPTGSGKTTLFSWCAAGFKAPVVVLVHRRELATQAAKRLQEFGVDFGYILAEMPRRPAARVQVASVQTLVRRTAPPARLVIVDEAHLSTADSWSKILACYPDALILGVTATPWRLSGKPLAGAYDRCVVIATPRELREQGYLCDYSGFSYKAPDLSDVGTVADEYNKREAAEAMREPSIVANIVEQWQAHSADLSTVVFAVTVEHSRELAKQFQDAGVQAEHLDGETPLHVRNAILRRVDQGQTRVLCNVGVAIEGLDIPRLKCCVLARPTKSLARAIQMMGRVRRPCRRCLECGTDYVPPPNAPFCPKCHAREFRQLVARIHDHAFLIDQHGLPDDDRDYTLNAKAERPKSLTECPECFAKYRGPRCPVCDREAPPAATERRELVTVDDAEQFAFDSSSAVEVKTKPKPDELPPVHVQWTDPGKVIEGKLVAITEEPSNFGPRKFYTVQGPRRRYLLPGTAHLNQLFARTVNGRRIQISDSIRVTYEGEENLSGGRWRKKFRLEVDDGR